MKRILSMVLCAGMILSLLTGCSDAEATKQLLNDIAEIASTYEAETEAETAEEGTVAAKAEGASEVQTAQEKHEAGKYPIAWDLTEIYETDEDWQADYSRACELIEGLSDFRGKLSTAQGICDYVSYAHDGELAGIMSKLSVYAQMRSGLNASDPVAAQINARVTDLSSRMSEATAYVDAEIFSMSMEERKKIFSDPLLEKYAYSLRAYTDEDTVHYSEETQKALAVTESLYGTGDDIYSVLAYSDIQFPTITLPDGTEKTIDTEGRQSVVNGSYDRDFKFETSELYYRAYAAYANTFTRTLEATIRENIASAKLAGYDSYLEYTLKESDIEPEIYENIKTMVHELLPAYQEYLADLKNRLGVEQLYLFETTIPTSSFSKEVSYDDSCEEMLKALEILGSDYTDNVRKVIEGGHVDVYAADGKETGAYEISYNDKTYLPFILMNHTGDLDSTSTLCHEMGHTMYAYYSENNEDLNRTSNDPTIFTHEVASTTNEFLLSDYRMENAGSEEEKKTYMEGMFSMINGTVINQILYSEFEEYLYQIVEDGGALDAETISDKWIGLYQTYYGEDVKFPESYRYRWSEVPHLHYGYYVYQYATSATYAAALSEKIFHGEEGAVENYRKFLTLGNSMKSSALLKQAGADPLSEDTYQYLIDYYKNLLAEYEKLE